MNIRILRILLLLISLPTWAGTRAPPYPIWLYNDNIWQRSQIMHLQTQQQLQAQDQYRRNLLMQDQERQLQRLQDEQLDLKFQHQDAIMHQHIDRLRLYSRFPKPPKANKVNKK